MTFNKKLILTGYQVKYIDRREPAPYAEHTETYVVDEEWISASNIIGRCTADLIEARYESQGYKVIEIHRIPGKKTVSINLAAAWAD